MTSLPMSAVSQVLVVLVLNQKLDAALAQLETKGAKFPVGDFVVSEPISILREISTKGKLG